MTLAFGFVFTNYILYGLGVTALLISEALSPPVIVFSLLLLFILFIAELKQKIPIIKGKSFPGFYIGPLALIFSYFVFDLPLLDTFCYFFLILLFTRIVYKKEINDYLFCYIISLACLLIGAMGAAELSFGAVFLAFFIVISWSMILYHLCSEKEDELKLKKSAVKYALYDDNAYRKEKIGGSFFGLTTFLIIGSLTTTLIIFILMPRLGKGYVTLFGKNSQLVSGFSNETELGDIGRIKLDHSVAMRIETYRDEKKIEPGDDIYWRGIALDYYDGKRWSNTFSKREKVKKVGKNSYKIGDGKKSSEIIKQVIYLEPIGSNAIFTTGKPLNLSGPFQWVGIDSNNNLSRYGYQYGRVRFVVHSDISTKGRYMLSPDGGQIKTSYKEIYLQLPPLSNRFLELTRSVVNGVVKKHRQAVVMESYLKTTFGYTLDLSHSEDISPIDNFLFVRKEGHCEYFASTMVLMLRTLGIPARLVNGFLKGEWNQIGEYLIVRQSHAHSWVEAMIDDKGWVVFDPTPPAAIPFVSSSFSATMVRYLDAIRMKWYRYVINYSWQDQRAIAIGARNKSLKIKEKFNANFSELLQYFKTGLKNSRPDKLALYAVMFVSLLVFGRKIISAIQLKQGNVLYSQKKSSKIYFKMLKLLKKKGFEKKETMTPQEFAFQIKNKVGPAWEKIKIITNAYYQTRFGDHKLNKGKEKEMELSLKELSRQISN